MSKQIFDGDPHGRERDPRDLTEAKLTLVRARERGAGDSLSQALRAYPEHADALTSFDLGLIVTQGYEREPVTADVLEAGQAARAMAFTRVFGAAPVVEQVAQPAAAVSLKALRQRRDLALMAAARRLGLGVDVLSALEAGRIAVSSVPARLTQGLAALLDATAEQINGALALSVAPALRRAQSSSPANPVEQVSFADAIQGSHDMSPEQKAEWLNSDGE